MKRKILSVAFVVMSLMLTSAVAKNNDFNTQEDCLRHKCCVEKNQKIRHHGFNPFEGIELSTEQKSQLENLKNDLKKDKKCENKKEKQCHKFEKYKKYQELKKKNLNEIKQILTPEQYIKYLENIVLKSSPKPHFNKR